MKTKGFTLIELLVVITIIGILATGATALYTGSQQKARDSVRISDVSDLNSALVQEYSDKQVYPAAAAGIATALKAKLYLSKVPVDAKTTQTAADGTDTLDYRYSVGSYSGVTQQAYEVSTAFEAKGNIGSGTKAASDDGADDNRFEMGIDTATLDTTPAGITATTAVVLD